MRALFALVAAAAATVAAPLFGSPRTSSALPPAASSAVAPLVARAAGGAEAGAVGAAAAARRAELAAELERVIAGTGWPQDEWSVLVVSLDGGDTLFAHRPEASLMPASNLKLFTTAAALQYLGPEFRYSTYLTALGPLRDGVLAGDLVVYGTGDPTLSERFFESKTSVWEALADSLAALGVQRIEGDLVGDASYFEGPAVGEGWQTAYVTHTYAAPASALSFNDNVVTLRVTPGSRAGAKPEIQVIPGGRVRLVNEATTVASGRTRIEVEREGYAAPIVVTGQVRRGDPGVWRAVPVVSPPSYAASVLEEVLAERGIQVTGSVRAVDRAAASMVTGRRIFAPGLEREPVVQVLAVHRSPPLLEILKVINQRSHNLYAESVLRTVGRVTTGSGSVRGGAAAVSRLLDEQGMADSTLYMDDGSGLSILDRASARTIVRLLVYMANESPHREAYMETLPEAATSRGLRRMQRTAAAGNLRAKTGTIDRVSALSGYVTARNGERLAFSIISNNVPSTWKAKRIEDRIGARLASFSRPLPVTGRLATAEEPEGPAEAPDAVAPTSSAVEAPSPATEVADGGSYTIRKGDTLDGIARRLGTTVAALEAANPDVSPRRLIPGRTLTLPGRTAAADPSPPAPEQPTEQPAEQAAPEEPPASGGTYTIRKGDTLDAIARSLGTTVAALEAANPGLNPRRLMPGATLRLPAR